MGSTSAGSPDWAAGPEKTPASTAAHSRPSPVGYHASSGEKCEKPAASKRARYLARPLPVSVSSAASARSAQAATQASALTTVSAAKVRCAPASSSR